MHRRARGIEGSCAQQRQRVCCVEADLGADCGWWSVASRASGEASRRKYVRHDEWLTRIIGVASRDPLGIRASHAIDESFVVYRQHRRQPEVRGIDDWRTRGNQLRAQRIATLRFLVASQVDAKPIATIGRVTAMTFGPHRRHRDRVHDIDSRLRHMTSLPRPPQPRPPRPRRRARELGLTFGSRPTGPNNAITDVPGVRVGHATVWHGEGAEPIARTGVTAIVLDDLAALFARPMAAAPAVLNGAGELTGAITMAEWGTIETPIMLTATSSVGRVCDGVVDELYAAGASEVVVPVVGECDDSHLDNFRRRWVTAEHAREAITKATTGAVAEGAIGAGAGMVTMGFKAGIGTASRHIPEFGTVGVLLLCNFGSRADLRIGGVHIGPRLLEYTAEPATPPGGSCIGIVCTDIPLDARQLGRVATRVGLGLARCGAVAHHGSGDIFCAVSTTNRVPRRAKGLTNIELLGDGSIDAVFAAVVDATEEAVCNALFVADTVAGVDGTVVPGLPVDQVLRMLARGG